MSKKYTGTWNSVNEHEVTNYKQSSVFLEFYGL